MRKFYPTFFLKQKMKKLYLREKTPDIPEFNYLEAAISKNILATITNKLKN